MNFAWPFPDEESSFYRLKSRIVIRGVATFSKVLFCHLNRPTVYNAERFLEAVKDPNTALLTVCNHHSCIDDPLLWGVLSWKTLLLRPERMRWTLAAHDVCFRTWWQRWFFALGRCIPVVRGDGVYQRAVNMCIDILNRKGWVHMFPEGMVVQDKRNKRLKWGVGRMIAECRSELRVIPFYHIGFDDILPNQKPYIPRILKRVTVVFGDEIVVSELKAKLKSSGASAEETRKALTDVIQMKLFELRKVAEKLHQEESSPL